jgi:hypothetical protein
MFNISICSFEHTALRTHDNMAFHLNASLFLFIRYSFFVTLSGVEGHPKQYLCHPERSRRAP